jgi:chromosome partitioning protein
MDGMTGIELRDYRDARGMGQAELASYLNEKLGRRYDRNRISRWENGAERVPQIVAQALQPGPGPVGIPALASGPAFVTAVINQKGGVQKTSSVVNLAYILAKAGKRVLVVDCDAQGSATIHLGIYPPDCEQEAETLKHVLFSKKPILEAIKPVCDGLFDLLPSGISLAKADAEIYARANGALLLRARLDEVRYTYDFILLDCPPNLGQITVSALNAADGILIPTQAEMLALMGIPQLLESVEDVQVTVNPKLSILGILPTRIDTRRNQDKLRLQDLARMAEENHIRMFPPVRNSVVYPESVNVGRPALAIDPSAPGAEAFQEVAEALIETAAARTKEGAHVVA